MAHLLPRQAKVREVVFAKRRIRLYSIGWMAYAFRRHPETVKTWEKKGFLPPPILRTGGKWRYYTANEIEDYSVIFQSSGVGSGARFDKQAFAMNFFDRMRHLKELFRADPTQVKKHLSNEKALLAYAADTLSDRDSAEL